MKRLLTALVLVTLASTVGAQVGEKAKLDVVQWFNTPPIALDQLQGHAVLVEVFRTW